MIWILDTDTLSLLQRAHPSVTRHVDAIDSTQVVTTVVTFEEQMYGRLNRIRRADSEDKLIFAYTQLKQTLQDFKTIEVLEFN